jgi:hypothetical protein
MPLGCGASFLFAAARAQSLLVRLIKLLRDLLNNFRFSFGAKAVEL